MTNITRKLASTKNQNLPIYSLQMDSKVMDNLKKSNPIHKTSYINHADVAEVENDEGYICIGLYK